MVRIYLTHLDICTAVLIIIIIIIVILIILIISILTITAQLTQIHPISLARKLPKPSALNLQPYLENQSSTELR